jgi:O-antigen/teichoic acid export membrane protein
MDTASVRLLAESLGAGNGGRARATVDKTLAVTLAGALIVSAAFALGLWQLLANDVFHSSRLADLETAAVLMLVVMTVQSTLVGWFRGFSEMRAVALFETVLGSAFWGVALLGGWAFRAEVTDKWVLAARAVALALVVVVMIQPLIRRVRPLAGPGTVSLSEIADLGWALMGATVIATLVGNTSDLLILGAYRSSREVAAYAIAVSIAALVSAPYLALTVAIGPAIAELEVRDERQGLENLVRGSTGVVSIPTVLTAVVIILTGRHILGIVFGAPYETAAHVLVVLCIAQCAFVLTGPCGLMLVMTGHHRVAFITVLVGAVFSVGLDIWAAPRYGALGVAVATSSVVILDNIVTTMIAHRLTGIWTFARFRLSDVRTAIATARLTA